MELDVLPLRPAHGRGRRRGRGALLGLVVVVHALSLLGDFLQSRRLRRAPLRGLPPRVTALTGPGHNLRSVADESHPHPHHGLDLQAEELQPRDLELEHGAVAGDALHLRAHGQLDAHVLVHGESHVIRQRVLRILNLRGRDVHLQRAS